MIPLNTINAAKVLDGARVPLVNWDDNEQTVEISDYRAEWIGDRMIELRVSTREVRDVDIVWEFHAIDPTDPDTARLIDRRVAEAIGLKPSPFYDQRLHIRTGDAEDPWAGWTLDGFNGWTTINNSCQWPAGRWTGYPRNPVLDVPALAGLPLNDANLPEARARLLCALYPPA